MFFSSSWSKQGLKGARASLYSKNYQHKSIFCRFWVAGHALGGSLACFSLEKSTFLRIGVSFAEKSREVRCLVQVQKYILIKMSVPARPARTLCCRQLVIRYAIISGISLCSANDEMEPFTESLYV